MKITRAQIEKLASLVKLRLTEEEVEKFSHQLTDILNYVDQLNELPLATDTSAEAGHRLEELREDIADGGRYRDQILQLGPDQNRDDDLFTVPAVFGQE